VKKQETRKDDTSKVKKNESTQRPEKLDKKGFSQEKNSITKKQKKKLPILRGGSQ